MSKLTERRCDRCRDRRGIYAENGLCLACTRFASNRAKVERAVNRNTEATEGVRADRWPQTGVGAVLKRYRQQNGLTQNNVAKLLNLDQTYVSRLESGKRRLNDPIQIRRIADTLGLPVIEFGLMDDPAGERARYSHDRFDPRYALSVVRQARTRRTWGQPRSAFAEIESMRPSIEAWAKGRTDEDSRLLLAEVLLARSLVIADLLPEESLQVPVTSMKRSWHLIGGQSVDVPSAYVLSNLGNCLRRAKQLAAAVPMFETVITKHREPEERVSTAMLLAKASGSLRRADLFTGAIQLARRNLDRCEPGTALINDFSLTEIEARGLLQIGEFDSALRVLRRRDGSGELLATPQWRIIFAVTRGEALAANGLYAEAIDDLTACVHAAQAIGLPHQLQRIQKICQLKLDEYPEMQVVVDAARAAKSASHSRDLL